MDPLSTIILHQVMIPGLSGDGMTVAEASALRADIADYEAQLAAFGLDDLADVSAASPSSGQVLKFDGTTWTPQTPATGIPHLNEDGDPGTTQYNVTQLMVADGLTVEGVSTGVARIVPVYSGDGVSDTVARGDHKHTIASISRATFSPGGYMSSGTRSLASTSVTLTNGIGYLVKATLNMQMRGADPGACYYRLSVTINGNTRTSNSGVNGFWCVQGVPDKTTWSHHQQITGTGAAISVSAAVQYDSGGGFYTDAGEIEIELVPRQ